jgi:hypothetical protein
VALKMTTEVPAGTRLARQTWGRWALLRLAGALRCAGGCCVNCTADTLNGQPSLCDHTRQHSSRAFSATRTCLSSGVLPACQGTCLISVSVVSSRRLSLASRVGSLAGGHRADDLFPEYEDVVLRLEGACQVRAEGDVAPQLGPGLIVLAMLSVTPEVSPQLVEVVPDEPNLCACAWGCLHF